MVWNFETRINQAFLSKSYTVLQGTCKVVITGSVTISEGNTEKLTETSTQMAYPAE